MASTTMIADLPLAELFGQGDDDASGAAAVVELEMSVAVGRLGLCSSRQYCGGNSA